LYCKVIASDDTGCFLFQPDPEKASHDEAAEREILEKVKASMTEEDLAKLARATQELKLKQETPDPPEALRSVPSLFLCDIPKEPIHVPTEVIVNLSVLYLNILHTRILETRTEHLYTNCRLGISME
jgi:Zn-dependent M16 (insulinase) family peptidase